MVLQLSAKRYGQVSAKKNKKGNIENLLVKHNLSNKKMNILTGD
jgi:hypothetical protein